MTEKKLIKSRAKVPEVGCVVVRVRDKTKLEAIAKNVETSRKVKLKKKQRREQREQRELAWKGQSDQCNNKLKFNPFNALKG